MDDLHPIRRGGSIAFPYMTKANLRIPTSPGGFRIQCTAGQSNTRAGAIAIYTGAGYYELHFWNRSERIEFVARSINGVIVCGAREVTVDIAAPWFKHRLEAWSAEDGGAFVKGIAEQIGRVTRKEPRIVSIDLEATRHLLAVWYEVAILSEERKAAHAR